MNLLANVMANIKKTPCETCHTKQEKVQTTVTCSSFCWDIVRHPRCDIIASHCDTISVGVGCYQAESGSRDTVSFSVLVQEHMKTFMLL